MAIRKAVTRLGLVAGLISLLLAGCQASTSRPHSTPRAAARQPSPALETEASPSATAELSPKPSATPSQKGPEAPVTASGSGRSSSASFNLEGGDYSAAYNLTGECVYFANLRSADGSSWPINFSPRSGPTRGNTQVRNVPPGSYVADVITGPPPACGWVISFTRS